MATKDERRDPRRDVLANPQLGAGCPVVLRGHMPSDVSQTIKQLREDIKNLSDRQHEMLKQARFGGMSKAEVDDYDKRHLKIMKLVRELARLTQP